MIDIWDIDISMDAAFVLDTRGRVVFANGMAETLLKANDGLRVVLGRLVFDDLTTQSEYGSAMTHLQAAGSPAASPERILRIPSKCADAHEAQLILIEAEFRPRHIPASGVVLLLIRHRRAPDLLTQLSAAYKLTRSESMLCCLFVKSGCLVTSARSLGITVNTARSHLKQVFRKLNVSSQTQLLHRLATWERMHAETRTPAGS